MYGVGFEAVVVETVISRELFSCFVTTPPAPPFGFYLFEKGKTSRFDLWWPGSSEFIGSGAGLMFNRRAVQQSDMNPQI